MSDFINLNSNNFSQVNMAQDSAHLYSLEKKLKSRENKEELKKVSKDFEAVFLNQLFQIMDKTIERNGLINGGPGEDTFRSMLYEKMTQQLAERPGGSGLGLADAIYKQLENKVGEGAKSSDEGLNKNVAKTYSLDQSPKTFSVDKEI